MEIASRPSATRRDIREPPQGGALSRKAHTRRSHRKTRTGCSVCKIRRVKCDEVKPACTRCTSTGRKCDGYYPVISTPSTGDGWPLASPGRYPGAAGDAHGSLSFHRLTWGVVGDDAERRSFSYMRERAIYDISGYFESEFWDRLVLRISHTEPAVRHALLGLCSLCETYDARPLAEDHDATRQQFALQQYNKAVVLLNDAMSASPPQLEVILASCLVFVWLEFMRNDLDAALIHLKGGLKILDDFRRPSQSTAFQSPLIDESLIRSFSRLEIQATVFGSPNIGFVASDDLERMQGVPDSFSSIEQARNTLQALLGTVFRFVRRISDPGSVDPTAPSHPWLDPSSLEATCGSLLGQLQSWEGAIENSPASTFASTSPRRIAAMCLLRVYHQTVTILLKTLFTQSQMVYDSYDSCFEEVLTLGDRLIRNSQHMGRTIFFDMGVMAPLFYVVLKCRNLALRRKALSLLELAPCREGMWYRQDAIEYAEWKIGIEERHRGQLSETEPLPEVARIYNEQMKEVFLDGRQRTVVSFQWRGVDGIEYGEDVTDLNTRMGQLI